MQNSNQNQCKNSPNGKEIKTYSPEQMYLNLMQKQGNSYEIISLL